jgi:AraC-like DNA-binding protein
LSKAFGLPTSPATEKPQARDSQVRAVATPSRGSDPTDADATGPRLALADGVVPLTDPRHAPIPDTLPERLDIARERLRAAAESGARIRVYEVALDLDMSEFHFARQFRAAYGSSPHVFYDEVRAARARLLLESGCSQGRVARQIGLRRPAELRALLDRRRGLPE